MNIFQQQEDARRMSRRLIILFLLAVVGLVLTTNIVVLYGWWATNMFVFPLLVDDVSYLQDLEGMDSYLTYQRFLVVSSIVVGVVSLKIVTKRREISSGGGGKAIAKKLGGRLIDSRTQKAEERTVLNIVEEMAIASGTAVPPVYLLYEKGINAFAAGFNPNDAVIGVSKGAIEGLNREQLQGVIAHEFSHIFNGDMRLNSNLVSVLSGIMFIGVVGSSLLKATYKFDFSRLDLLKPAFPLIGFLLVLVGFIGVFISRLIQASVSRQREFLADASAVQFTRNPQGISGALKVIGGSRHGSSISHLYSDEVSHMFFGNSINSKHNRKQMFWFSTHPRLEDRIRRIEPLWDGEFIKPKGSSRLSDYHGAKVSDTKKRETTFGALTVKSSVEQIRETIECIGSPDEASFEIVKEDLSVLGGKLRNATRSSISARALIYLLLLSRDKKNRQEQELYLEQNDSEIKLEFDRLKELVEILPNNERIELVELCIPSLKTLSRTTCHNFLVNLKYLVELDKRIEFFEWLLFNFLNHYLKPCLYDVKSKEPQFRGLNKLKSHCIVLISFFSYSGEKSDEQNYELAFSKGIKVLEIGEQTILPKAELGLQNLQDAILQFKLLYPLVKPRLLKACVACIEADGNISCRQMELLRLLSALLDCPLPLIKVNQVTVED